MLRHGLEGGSSKVVAKPAKENVAFVVHTKANRITVLHALIKIQRSVNRGDVNHEQRADVVCRQVEQSCNTPTNFRSKMVPGAIGSLESKRVEAPHR